MSEPPEKTSPSSRSSVSSIAVLGRRDEQRPAARALDRADVGERDQRGRQRPDTPRRLLGVRCDADDRPHLCDCRRSPWCCRGRVRRRGGSKTTTPSSTDDDPDDDGDDADRDDELPRLLPAQREGAARRARRCRRRRPSRAPRCTQLVEGPTLQETEIGLDHVDVGRRRRSGWTIGSGDGCSRSTRRPAGAALAQVVYTLTQFPARQTVRGERHAYTRATSRT